MADYTLTYQKVIIDGGLNLFPKWGNKEQSIFTIPHTIMIDQRFIAMT